MVTDLQVSIIEVEGEPAVVLPREVLDALGVAIGDVVEAELAPDGVRLKHCRTALSEQTAVASEVMARRRLALRALAKVTPGTTTVEAVEAILAEDAEILRALSGPATDQRSPKQLD